MINTKTVFDVGANDCYTTMCLGEAFPDVTVFGFEPSPQLCQKARDINIGNLPNYILTQCAVSDYNGSAVFKMTAPEYRGKCSSLLDFNDNAQKHWPGKEDLNYAQEIEVPVVRLDTFIDQWNWTHGAQQIIEIDYFHCDTQGNDLKALQGLGKWLKTIKRGVVEAPKNAEVALYKGQHTLDEMERFLWNNGFKITFKRANDPLGNEWNIFFEKA